MAIFKNEMNWSSFQEKQLSALNSIGKVFSDAMYKSYFNSQSAMTKVENSLNSISNSFTSFADSSMKRASTGLSHFASDVKAAGADIRKFANDLSNSGIADKAKNLIDTIGKQVGGWEAAWKKVDDWSKLSNAYIQNTGMSGKEIRAFRADMVSLIGDLNKSTGWAYDPKESYQKLLAISENVTSDLDALGEMARPILLASESLNVSITGVADLFNRFYVRYSFSSSNMETVLNNIRENTAGNSATAEATMENLKTLESWIGTIAKGDTEKMESLMNTISEYTSYYESMGLDSSIYTDYLKKIMGGDYGENPELVNILNQAGYDATTATWMMRSGDGEDIKKIAEAIPIGLTKITEIVSADSTMNYDPALRSFGLDPDFARNAHNVVNYAENYSSIEEFLEGQKDKGVQTIAQQVEDKYYSMGEKINTWLEKIYSKLSSIQEMNPLGFGFSDLALAGMLLKNFRASSSGGAGNSAKGLGNLYGNSITPTASTSAFGSSGVWINKVGGGLATPYYSTTAAGAATLGGAAAGVGMGIYGGVEAYKDFKEGNTTGGVLNTVGAAGGAVGAGALLALGASNPVGWVALAIGGAALLGAKLHEAATTIGSADAVEAAYEEASKSISKQAKSQENTLLDIKSNLVGYDEKVDDGKKLQEQINKLVQSGILSEEDAEKARKSNAESLRELTDAYIAATKEWETETNSIINKYGKLDKKYAAGLQGNLESLLQKWNDEGELTEGSEKLGAVEDLFYDLMSSLDTRAKSGETFDKNTQLIYDDLVKAFSDGSLSKKEANMIIDEGITNTAFQNAQFNVEDLIKAVKVMGASNTAGSSAYSDVTKGLGTYYGVDNTAYVADVVGRLKSKNGVSTKDEAIKLLEDLEKKGFTSSIYPEIAEAASAWGLSGYAEGSNYIEHDQLAVIHEGEAVVPKKYNPAVNSAEFEYLASHVSQNYEDTASEARKNRETLASVAEELREIRTFLSTWKSDNDKNSRISAAKSRNSVNSAFIARFLEV